jgi:hypothetical protein
MSEIAVARGDARALHSINQELFFLRNDATTIDPVTASPFAGQLSLFG